MFRHRKFALVGDRLYTDIRMARDAGAVAVLTLTGETKRAGIADCTENQRPDIVVDDLGEFGRLLKVHVEDVGEDAHRIFRSSRRFFAPPPLPRDCLKADIRSLYPWYRWRALESTFLGYAAYYLVRNNIPVVTKELSGPGDIMAVTAMTYGISKFLMGSVSDRSDARKFLAAGLLLSAVCNFAFGSTSNYYAHLSIWAVNGFAQEWVGRRVDA